MKNVSFTGIAFCSRVITQIQIPKESTKNKNCLMKDKILNSKLILLLPAYWACLFDEIITIINQSDEYWKGDLGKANEANPIGAFMMANHTYGIFIICGLWLILIGIIGFTLSDRKLKIFALFVLIAHSFGASSWLSYYYSFWFSILFIFINSVMFIECENLYESRRKENLKLSTLKSV